MRNHRSRPPHLVACLLGGWLLFLPVTTLAQAPHDLFSLSLEELSQIKVHVATGTPKPISTAPAVTTVITAADIEAMGAQSLAQALEPVPGLHVSYGGLGRSARYDIRGIATGLNPQTLVMVDGVPQTSLWYGDRFPGWAGIPVKFIQRIEIIRGPGSAVYGADAFAGVINIITKGPQYLQGTKAASLSYGSFNTGRLSILRGDQFGEVKTAFALALHRTDGEGFDTLIEEPAQLNSPGVTLNALPRPLRLGRKDTDARFDASWGNYQLRLGWQQTNGLENGRGLAMALDPEDRQQLRRGSVDLGWRAPNLGKNWQLESRLTYLYMNASDEGAGHYFPSGTFGNLGGAVSLASLSEENARFSVTALYQGWARHQLRFGAGFYWGDLYRTSDRLNFSFDPSTGVIQPPGGSTQLADTGAIFQPEAQRTNSFGFVQDEWTLADNWELTAGVRFDHYSDFGDTTNPRLALVWQTTPTFTSKLLYGEAFRAPAFAELHAHANVWEQGNLNLKPERLRSLEAAFSWQPSPNFSWELNLYQFYIRDLILLAPISATPSLADAMAQNIGRYRGRGVETELRYQFSQDLQGLFNASHQQTRDRDTGADLGRAPDAQASFWLRWQFARGWLLTPQVNWVGRMRHTADDPRAAVAGYTTFALALRKRWQSGLDVALIGYNLFAAKREDPSRYSATLDAIGASSEVPQGGRSVTVEANIHW